MLKLAFSKTPDVQLPYSFFSEAEHDYLYVKQGEQAQVAMALMFIEQGQFKWVSADRVVLVTEQGRIVRTVGLKNDLLHLTNTASDPLKKQLSSTSTTSWSRIADWQQHEYGYPLRSTFQYGPVETLQFFGQPLDVVPLIENIQYAADANFVRFDDKWQNRFWLDAKTGVVLKSVQTLVPGAEAFEMIFISEVVRQLRRAGVDVAADAV
ncbi:YjbF family lipoprotein [Arsukibacterium sp.]|uniref:YjbF family lipoprotein n=1 Tax=Arsukibacterium sp. TaxID=1977258 RepID=UPI0026392B23|nr:YjbF family lipoprotein [Arsukibacterium sp.]